VVTRAVNLRLGSRGSLLARWQAHFIKARLESEHPDITVHIQILHSTGDRITDVPLSRIGDRGLFTKELDQAIIDGHIDVAVHSLKDVPTHLTDGLELAAIAEREDPRDAFLAATGHPQTIAELPRGACVGTSSLRRRAQLLHDRPDLDVRDLRGNLDTRLARLAEGPYDAIVLALAGVRRLGHEDLVGELLGPPRWLSAVGQGALALVARLGDGATAELLACLEDPATRRATTAERAFLRALEGGCQVPIGALAVTEGDELLLDGFVASLDGATYLRDIARGPVDEPEAVGQTLAARLRKLGADDVLSEVRRGLPPGLPAPGAP
jgi:hydroxymethylbilane synthase